MKIAILTDTALDIMTDEEKGIFSVPLYVNCGMESYKDLVEIERATVYERVVKEQLTTSAPSVDDFLLYIDKIIEQGYDEIIAIHLSGELSGTISASKIALDSRDIPYKLFDTLNVSIAGGFFVHYTKTLIDKGLGLDEIEIELTKQRNNARIIASVKDLKYLIRGGRLKPIKGAVGSALNIKPILSTTEEGKIEPLSSIMGEKKTLKKIIEIVKERLGNADMYYLSIMYAEDESKVELFEEEFKNEIENANIYIKNPISSVLTAQAGPEIYGISYMVIE